MEIGRIISNMDEHSNHVVGHGRLCLSAIGFGAISGLMLLAMCACIAVEIAVSCIGGEVFRYFTTCHGTQILSHISLGVLCAFQLVCLSIKLDNSQLMNTVRIIDTTPQSQSTFGRTGPSHQVLGLPHLEVYGQYGMPEYLMHDGDSGFGFDVDRGLQIAGDFGLKPVSPSTTAGSVPNEKSDAIASLQIERTLVYPHSGSSFHSGALCWNSIWMTLHHILYILGFHAAVLGWRTYGGTEASAFMLASCEHLNVPSFGSEMPIIRNVVSDFAFIQITVALCTSMLSLRKFGLDPYLLSSYFIFLRRSKCFCGLRGIALVQSLLQVAIIILAATNVTFAWFSGYGTPTQIVCAGLVSAGVVWVISVLTHVLQTDRLNPPFRPTLSFHGIWSSLNVSIVWACGFMFYLTVHGIYNQWPYMAIHLSAWILYTLVSLCKKTAVFPNKVISDTGDMSWLPNIAQSETSCTINLPNYYTSC